MATGFLFMGGGEIPAAFGETQQEGCALGAALGYPVIWDKLSGTPEYACYSTTWPGLPIEGTACILCSDGNFRKDKFDSLMSCPDDSWTLMPDADGTNWKYSYNYMKATGTSACA